MAIAKKPISSTIGVKKISDNAADAFIAGAETAPRKIGKVPIMLRVDADLLNRIDAASKNRGITRTAWIMYNICGALENE